MKKTAYKQAGVDIDKAAELVDRIKPHVKNTQRSGVMSGLGGFGALFDLKETQYQDPILVSGTDGVGTKIKLAIEQNIHDTIGIDAVAMCVNDIIVQGAEPLFFLDYFATGTLNNDVAENVIKGIAKGCEMANCALIGGETAEMPGLYAQGDYDIAGFSVGAVERSEMITGENIQDGDIILGLASSGLHSNGFSLVRKILNESKNTGDNALAKYNLLEPTKIYVCSILNVLKSYKKEQPIKGLVHITGGGFLENIPRILPKGLSAHIDTKTWTLPTIFKDLKHLGSLSNEDLASTLNCGIGMIVICEQEKASDIKAAFEKQGEETFIIGSISTKETLEEADVFGNESVKIIHGETQW